MPDRVRAIENETERLFHRSAKSIKDLILRIAKADVEGNLNVKAAAMRDLADLLASSQGVADMVGRRRLWLEMDAISASPRQLAALNYADAEGPQVVVPGVTFEEAINDIVRRDPRLAGSAEEVASVYTREHGFSMVRSIDRTLTVKIQRLLGAGARAGVPERDLTALIDEISDFGEAYSQTVVRNSLNTAYTAGRFQEAARPGIRRVAPGFKYMTAGDVDVRGRQGNDRENHWALRGLMAAFDDPIWQRYATPNGHG